MMVFILNRTLRERILPFRNHAQGLNTRNYLQKKDRAALLTEMQCKSCTSLYISRQPRFFLKVKAKDGDMCLYISLKRPLNR